LRVTLIYGDAAAARAPGHFPGYAYPRCQLRRPVRLPGIRAERTGCEHGGRARRAGGIAKAHSGTTVTDQAGCKAERAKPMQQMLMLVCAALALASLVVLLGIGNTRPRSAIREPSLRADDHGLPADCGADLLAGHAYRAHHAQFAGALEDRQLFFSWALVLAMKNHGSTVFSPPARSLIIVVVVAALAQYCSRIRRVDCDLPYGCGLAEPAEEQGSRFMTLGPRCRRARLPNLEEGFLGDAASGSDRP
jgi:hypothetical protein